MCKIITTFTILIFFSNLLVAQDLFVEDYKSPTTDKISQKLFYESENYFTIHFEIEPLALKKGDGKGFYFLTKGEDKGYFMGIDDLYPIQVWDEFISDVLCSGDLKLALRKFYEFKFIVSDVGIIVEENKNGRFVKLLDCKVKLSPPFEIYTVTQRTGANFRNIRINEEVNLSEDNLIEVGSKTVTVKIWDNAHEDGDIVSVFLNDARIKKEITVKKMEYVFTLDLKAGVNIFKLLAHNEGTSSPNTAAILIDDGQNEHQRVLSSNKGDYAELKIVTKE